MKSIEYLMESNEESLRLDLKTKPEVIKSQAVWAGIRSGIKLADLGCGPGKTTYHLSELIGPKGKCIGVDISEQRIAYAKQHYAGNNIRYICRDIRDNLDDLGRFDFVLIRFVLEYYRSEAIDIVKNASNILRPGGILCLIDLDHNCLNHYGVPDRLQRSLKRIMETVERQANFDPYAGRKLYSYLYDMGYMDINVLIEAHHLIFGDLCQADEYNWTKKVEIAGKKAKQALMEYEGGCKEFLSEFLLCFRNPRRFTYTPAILCRGRRPKH